MRRVFPLVLSRALFALWIVLGTAEPSLLHLGPMGAAGSDAIDAGGMPGMAMPDIPPASAPSQDGAHRSDLATHHRSGGDQSKPHQHRHCIDCCVSCSTSALHSARVDARALLPLAGTAKPHNASERTTYSSPLQLLPPGTGPPRA